MLKLGPGLGLPCVAMSVDNTVKASFSRDEPIPSLGDGYISSCASISFSFCISPVDLGDVNGSISKEVDKLKSTLSLLFHLERTLDADDEAAADEDEDDEEEPLSSR